ncbi:MAG: hypothetical protein ACOX68_01415 [Candidatus Limivicinus sp.]|jgi:hypothetical protein
MLNSLKIILDETLNIYNLATLNGKLFIPFFICCIYLLLSNREEDRRARNYLVYPSLVLFFFLFNPVLIHYMCKYIAVDERIVRIYWPLPMEIVMAYCLVSFFTRIKKNWKRAVLLISAAFILLLGTGGAHAGVSYEMAGNLYKMPKGTKEVADNIYELSLHEDCDVIMPLDIFFWIREYKSSIHFPYIRLTSAAYKIYGLEDLDMLGQLGRDGGCRFIVVNTSEPSKGSLEDYSYIKIREIDGQDTIYEIYALME